MIFIASISQNVMSEYIIDFGNGQRIDVSRYAKLFPGLFRQFDLDLDANTRAQHASTRRVVVDQVHFDDTKLILRWLDQAKKLPSHQRTPFDTDMDALYDTGFEAFLRSENVVCCGLCDPDNGVNLCGAQEKTNAGSRMKSLLTLATTWKCQVLYYTILYYYARFIVKSSYAEQVDMIF